MRLVPILLILAAAFAQTKPPQPGPQVLTYFSPIDNTDQPYALYLPKNYDPGKKYPLVISLHGAGSNHRLNLRRVFGAGNRLGESDADATRYWPDLPDVDYIVASPLARGTLGYEGVAETDVLDVLAEVKKRFAIDEDRTYLTGLSMGGGGALWIGLTRPDLWAAIAVVCPSLPDGVETWAANAAGKPVHLFHGAADPVVPAEVSRVWKERLEEAGARVEHTEYPTVRHNSWDVAYKDGAIFDWFTKHKRNRFPDAVTFTTNRYAYRSAYWVTVDQLTPGTFARIEARFTAPNQIAVTTSDLAGFTLQLEAHPKFNPKRALRVTVDGLVISAPPGKSTIAFTKQSRWSAATAARRDTAASPGGPVKQPGSEGPVLAAFQSPHLYVYGTLGRPSVEELELRRGTAERAADWSTPLFRHLYSPRVLADRDVTEDDIAGHNLILFGNAETNALIQRFAGSLPLQLNPGAADYGLLTVAPKPGGGYLLLSSGLPWWTGFEYNRDGLTYLSPRYRLLTRFKDYIVFRSSQENVLAEGWFTPQWTLPAEQRTSIEKSGALIVQRPQAPAPPERPSISTRPAARPR